MSVSTSIRRYCRLFGWTMAACLAAGCYGAIHNQISWTVSPDYFLAFKFDQFRFPPEWRHRSGASLVGFLAAWWTGIAIGPALFYSACYRQGDCPRFHTLLRGMAIIITIAVLCGAASLLVGYFTAFAQDERFWIPPDVIDRAAFQRAGLLHDTSYAAAALGTLIACITILLNSRPPE